MISQPDLAARLALQEIENDKVDVISVPNCRKKFRVKFLKDYTVQRITGLLLEREEMEEAAKSGDSNKIMRSAVKHPYFSIKIAALATLNSYLGIKFIYPLRWRWWAFIRGFTEAQMAPLAAAIQKKNKLVLYDVLNDYAILDGYEDGYDDYDEGGTRPIPSRTHAGRIAAFVKDFPQYGDTKRFFFGLLTVTNYTARCVLNTSQIALMQSDLPHTLYEKRDKDGKKPVSHNDAAFEKQRQANEEMRKKVRQQTEGFTVEEVFSGEADKVVF